MSESPKPSGLVSIKQSSTLLENDEIRPKIMDTRTGEIFYIDTTAARVSRLQGRARAWAKTIEDSLANQVATRLLMVTLTYRPTLDQATAWRPNHIKAFMKRVRRFCGDSLLGYVWVAELQQRGEVHYHVLLLLKRGLRIPEPDKAGWWPHGHTRVTRARNPYYMLKYTSKARFKASDGDWKAFPKGLRLFAVWIAADVVIGMARAAFRWSALPRWLEAYLVEQSVMVKARRCPGGGWLIVGDIGPPERIRSPYRLVSLYD